MTPEKFDGVSVATRANVYFDGKCVSHTVLLPDGARKSVGVILTDRINSLGSTITAPAPRRWPSLDPRVSGTIPADVL